MTRCAPMVLFIIEYVYIVSYIITFFLYCNWNINPRMLCACKMVQIILSLSGIWNRLRLLPSHQMLLKWLNTFYISPLLTTFFSHYSSPINYVTHLVPCESLLFFLASFCILVCIRFLFPTSLAYSW